MEKKFLSLFFVLAALIAVLALTTNVLADQWYEYSVPSINEMSIYVDGELAFYGYCAPDVNSSILRWTCYTNQYSYPGLERGNTVDVRTVFVSNVDLKEVNVHTWVTGYSNDIEAKTSKFDVFSGNSYSKTLNLELPSDLDARDTYTLYVQIEQQHQLSGVSEAKLDTEIQRISNLIEILDAEIYGDNLGKFAPGNTVFADVVVKNRGEYRAEDVYVTASIAELGISRTVYLGNLDPNDNNDDEDARMATLELQLPSSTKSGTYALQIDAYNDEVSDKVVKNVVVAGITQPPQGEQPPVQGTVQLTAQVSSNDIEQGKGAVYSLLVSNFGSTAQNFVVDTVGTEGWATPTITPPAFTLKPGESRTVNVYVAAKEDSVEGQHTFSARVTYGSESKQVNLNANIIKSTGTQAIDMKTLFMIIGIVLAVVIVVLLIVLLTKGKTEKAEVESYY